MGRHSLDWYLCSIGYALRRQIGEELLHFLQPDSDGVLHGKLSLQYCFDVLTVLLAEHVTEMTESHNFERDAGVCRPCLRKFYREFWV